MYIEMYIEMNERMGQLGQQLLIATENDWRFWVERKQLIFCSGYSESTRFRNLARRECGTFQTRHPMLSTVWLLVL